MFVKVTEFNKLLRHILYIRVSQPGFRGNLGLSEMSLGVPREIVIEKINIVF
jgi:hypothetical protein